MAYQIFYSSQAQKYLSRLTLSKASALLKRIEYVALDPFKTDNNIVKLTGTISSYRLRIGDIRVVYELDTDKKYLYVVKVAPRGAVYSL